MSVFYNMETFILPRGLLMMHSGSLTFQKTNFFHTGSYIFEFVLLLALLICGLMLYVYANLKKTEKPAKTSKIKKMPSAATKPTPKIKTASKPNPEKSPMKTSASANKKRSPSTTSNSSAENVTTSAPTKKKAFSRLTYPHHPRLKSESQRSDENEKVSSNASGESNCAPVLKEINNGRDSGKLEHSPKSKPSKKDNSCKEKSSKHTGKGSSGHKSTGHRHKKSAPPPAPMCKTPESILCARAPTTNQNPAYTYWEMRFIEILSMYIIPHHELREYGFPFLIYQNPNYGVFFNTTQNLTLPEWKAKLKEQEILTYFENNEVQKERQCCRCRKHFFVSEKEKCLYHSGKLFSSYGGVPPSYSCCQQNKESRGCKEASDHVWNGLVPGWNGPINGFVLTQQSMEYPTTKHRVVSIDCEMCFTISGLELTRVTLLNLRGNVIYDSLVMPENAIIDYNTTFSGITKELMEQPGAAKTLPEVQQDILNLIDNNTIVIGHGLENDLRALKIIHYAVIDTSILFRDPNEVNFLKRHSLKNLGLWYLRREIQTGDGGHDSVEDASTCLDLVKYLVQSSGWNYVDYTSYR